MGNLADHGQNGVQGPNWDGEGSEGGEEGEGGDEGGDEDVHEGEGEGGDDAAGGSV